MTTLKTTASRSRILKRLPLLSLASALFLATPCAMAQSEAASGSSVADAPEVPEGTTGSPVTFRYLRLAGSTFHPVSTSGTYGYSGYGCIHPTAPGTPIFHHKLLLPEGSLVKYVRLYFRNTSAANAPLAFFTTYDTIGGYNEHVVVSGNNVGGYGSALSAEMNYFVDHYAEPINIAVNLGSVSDGSVQFCGVRVAYYEAGSLPPEIFKDGFE